MGSVPAGSRGKRVSAALEAVAEALVLIDPNDPTSLDVLLNALKRLAKAAPKGAAGDAPRAAMEDAAEIVARLVAGDVAEIDAELSRVVSRFEEAKAELTHTPMTERSRAGAPEVTPSDSPQATEHIDNPLADDPELVGDFIMRANEHLDSAESLLLTLERTPDDHEALDATFRVFHTIKGMSGFLGFVEIERFAHDTESFLDGPRKGEVVFSSEAFDAVFAAVDEMRNLVAARAAEVTTPVSSRPSQARVEPTPPGGLSSPGDAGPASGDRRENARKMSNTVVRVDEERLDLLLNMIGELVITETMVSESARADSVLSNTLAEKFSLLDKTTRELQELATSLRMVPLKATFGRIARLVRDLSQKANKRVELVVEGEETELDKAMVDLIYDPLVHLARNAVDHGIESGADRAAAGKPKQGTLTLRAFHAGGSVCVEIQDDGAGLDADAILAKARKLGLIDEDATPSSREIHEMLFLPGFSTASSVTDVSGRGVGMDVVKRAVDELRGSVDIHTLPGQGTCFTLRLPLTLAIIDGMVLRVGTERYVIPTLMIQRSLRPEAKDLSTVLERGEVLATDEGMVPLVRLARLFEATDADVDPTEGIVVLVGENDARAGLVVTELLGQQQTVIKPLGEGVGTTPGVSGGAIMPDGTVGLILDVSGLVRLANAERGVSEH